MWSSVFSQVREKSWGEEESKLRQKGGGGQVDSACPSPKSWEDLHRSVKMLVVDTCFPAVPLRV